MSEEWLSLSHHYYADVVRAERVPGKTAIHSLPAVRAAWAKTSSSSKDSVADRNRDITPFGMKNWGTTNLLNVHDFFDGLGFQRISVLFCSCLTENALQ